MKLINKFIYLVTALLFTGSLMAQTITYEERMELMHAEEAKVNNYIREHLETPIPQQFIDDYILGLEEEKDAHGHALMSAEEKKAAVEQVKFNYWRVQYFIENPAAYQAYQAASVTNCTNGNFELGNYTGYTLASGNSTSGNGYTSGQCTFIPTTSVTTLTPELPGANTDNFNLVGPGTDPYVPIQRVNPAAGLGGNWAMRVNGGKPLANPITSSSCWPDRGINRLSRTITLTSTTQEIGFYYALVLEYPNHPNANPFFVARAITAGGSELDRVCRVSDPTDVFFNTVAAQSHGGCSISQTVYSDWTCGELEVSGNIGDVITIEFYAVDCGAGAHFGYAYVDDICEPCVADTCNFQGSIDLDPAKDTCFTGQSFEVCGSYELAAVNCTSATVASITLNVIQGGTTTTLTVTPTIDYANQTFCFNLAPGDFPAASGSYDFEVEIVYNVNGGTHTETDIHTTPGIGNDVSFDCCDFDPQIVIVGDTCYDPCEHPEIPFLAYVIDANTGLPMATPPNNISWSTGATSTYTTAFVNTPLTVTVEDQTKCKDSDSTIVLCDTCDCEMKDFTLQVGSVNECQVGFSAWNYVVGGGKDCKVTKVIWNWGDGSSSTLSPFISPLHTYSGNGTYTVCASVIVQSSSDPRCADTLTKCTRVRIEKCQPCRCDITDFTLKNAVLNGCQAGFSAYNPVINSKDCEPYKIVWDFGDGTTTSLAPNVSPVHTYSSNGTYTVCATYVVQSNTDPDCIDQLKKCITIRVTNCRKSSSSRSAAPPASTGNNTTKSMSPDKDLSIFPNPTNGAIHVQYTSNTATSLRFEVLTADGKVMLTKEVQNTGQEVHMNTDELTNGTYFLKVTSDTGEEQTKTFIKE